MILLKTLAEARIVEDEVAEIKTYLVIKKIAAILLALCFFLPLSRCEYKYLEQVPASDDTRLSESVAVPPDQGTRQEGKYIVPAKWVDEGDLFGWLTVLAFYWPIISVLVSKKFTYGAWYVFLEPLLAVGTLYFVWIYAVGIGRTLPAGYAALAAASTLVFATAFIAVQRLRRRRL